MNFQIYSSHVKSLFISIYKPVLLMEVHNFPLFYLFLHELLNVLILSQGLKYMRKKNFMYSILMHPVIHFQYTTNTRYKNVKRNKN
jgi:hypothetical protein